MLNKPFNGAREVVLSFFGGILCGIFALLPAKLFEWVIIALGVPPSTRLEFISFVVGFGLIWLWFVKDTQENGKDPGILWYIGLGFWPGGLLTWLWFWLNAFISDLLAMP